MLPGQLNGAHLYPPFVVVRSSVLSNLAVAVKIRTYKSVHDRENTHAEQVFSRYEPSRPSFTLISILQYWKDTKDGTHYQQPDQHLSDQDAG